MTKLHSLDIAIYCYYNSSIIMLLLMTLKFDEMKTFRYKTKLRFLDLLIRSQIFMAMKPSLPAPFMFASCQLV